MKQRAHRRLVARRRRANAEARQWHELAPRQYRKFPGEPVYGIDPASPDGDKAMIVEGYHRGNGVLEITSMGELIEGTPLGRSVIS